MSPVTLTICASHESHQHTYCWSEIQVSISMFYSQANELPGQRRWILNWLLSTFTSGNASECQGVFRKLVIRGLQQRCLSRLEWEGTSEVQWSQGKGLGEGHQKRESFLVVLVMSKKKSVVVSTSPQKERTALETLSSRSGMKVSVAFKEERSGFGNDAKEVFLHIREMYPSQHMTECSCHALGGNRTDHMVMER